MIKAKFGLENILEKIDGAIRKEKQKFADDLLTRSYIGVDSIEKRRGIFRKLLSGNYKINKTPKKLVKSSADAYDAVSLVVLGSRLSSIFVAELNDEKQVVGGDILDSYLYTLFAFYNHTYVKNLRELMTLKSFVENTDSSHVELDIDTYNKLVR